MPLFAVPAPADYFIGLLFPSTPAGKFFLKNPEAVFIEEEGQGTADDLLSTVAQNVS
jgi:hypothetical protein